MKNEKLSIACRKSKYIPEKSLVALFPDIAAEWHPTKNTNLPLDIIMPGSNAEAWWLCETCGYEYPARIYDRTGYKHVGCPVCNKYMHTSFAEQALYFYVQQVFPNAQNKYTDIFDNQMELDIYIPELNMGIEYDGAYWHSENALRRNRKKYEICLQKGIKLIRVKENYRRYSICEGDCDYSIYREKENDEGLCSSIVDIFRILSKTVNVDIDIKRDRSEIKSKYIISFKGKSLQTKYPQLSLEWHPTKNGKLKPDMVLPGSRDKVYWLCPKCNYSYPASPAKRTKEKPTGCPVCANRVIISGINDLATIRPDLAAEWHPTKNGNIKPTQIAPNYSKKVWWVCPECNYEYLKTPNKRISAGQGCPKHAKERMKEKLHDNALKRGNNDLASQCPDLLEEWDYEANEGLCKPEDVTIGNSSINIHWICSVCGHKWQATAYNRIHLESGCKPCGQKKSAEARKTNALKKRSNDLASQ